MQIHVKQRPCHEAKPLIPQGFLTYRWRQSANSAVCCWEKNAAQKLWRNPGICDEIAALRRAIPEMIVTQHDSKTARILQRNRPMLPAPISISAGQIQHLAAAALHANAGDDVSTLLQRDGRFGTRLRRRRKRDNRG
jgi:hypothetical protein